MEKDAIINVKNVSLSFKMNKEKVDSIKEYFLKFSSKKIETTDFLALKDISFNVNRGDSVGVIGMNGSGKSSLLKVISGILTPTTGSAYVKGSIAPMIELGAGFDHELTARENIFLNGILIGMTRKEVNMYFESIVEFSELKEFLDVPLKNFSSGMLSRLSFAIATIKKPDILIVDEVLSVGDFKFQEKCMKRVEELLEGNTTLLFVSHSIEDVKRLCDRAIWLEKGKIKMIGESSIVCEQYKNQ